MRQQTVLGLARCDVGYCCYFLQQTLCSNGADCTGYLALLSGLVYDWLGGRDHLGPKVVAITGGALLCIGCECLAQAYLRN